MDDKKQKINCTVCSCEHQTKDNRCDLNQITVKPYPECDSGNKDETLCGNYKCNCK